MFPGRMGLNQLPRSEQKTASCKALWRYARPVMLMPAPFTLYFRLIQMRTEVSASAAAEFASMPPSTPRVLTADAS